MRPERFELALERLAPEAWSSFERLASTFLAVDYPTLRTVASMSGDQGRDAYLFALEDDPTVKLQYSIATDWRSKIRDTAKTIAGNFPETKVLVYVTNQPILAAADTLREEIRKEHKLFLDVVDRSWFLERVNSTPEREAAAAALAEEVVDPLLANRGLVTHQPSALDSVEQQAAFVYLGLQWEDDSREKGLTKIALEALVRAVLRETDSDHRMTRQQVREGVRGMLTGARREELDPLSDAALHRLTKSFLRHWRQPDEFCLTFEERQRLGDRLAELQHQDVLFQEDLGKRLGSAASALDIELTNPQGLQECVRTIIEKVLLARGESFVAATSSGRFGQLPLTALADAAIRDITGSGGAGELSADDLALAKAVAIDVLITPGETGRAHLRGLADTYTLFAFLRETPNVQSVIVKMFSRGDIWLDTTVLLPVFAEELAEPESRTYSNILRAAREAGLNLFVTDGVVEEIDAHMNFCQAYGRWDPRQGPWRGNVPFLYAAYAFSGRGRTGFSPWLENFRGSNRPRDDIAMYLKATLDVDVRNLQEEAEGAPEGLRTAVVDVWQRIHERRATRAGESRGDMAALRLADHDIENYLGVLSRRHQERDSMLGYTSWWLTLDRGAHDVTRKLALFHGVTNLTSPAISPDFMVSYLSLGPIRSRLARSTEARLPLVTDVTAMDLPADILAVAESIRDELADLPSHVVERRIRDGLDAGRLQLGTMGREGLPGAIERLTASIQRAAKQGLPAERNTS